MLHYGISQLHLSRDEFRLMPLGLFMNFRECPRQYNGISKPKQKRAIDEMIPYGV